MRIRLKPITSIAALMIALGACTKTKSNSDKPSPSISQNTAPQKEDYHCPMHPHVHSNVPGECPICHMKLVRSASSEAPQATEPAKAQSRTIKFYRNPMNPAVTSPVPAKDEMGMDYIPVYEEESQSSEVPGRGSVTLTPRQMELADIRTVEVVRKSLYAKIQAPGRAISSNGVAFQVFEEDLASVKIGQSFTAASPSLPGKTLRGRITSIDSFLDPMTRTARVSGLLSAGTPALRVEASLIGNLEIPLTNVLSVPEEAVLHTGKMDIVYISDSDGAFRPQSVVLGRKTEGQYEILEGLKAGQKVSAGLNFLLDSEARVRAAQ